jgi:hypothetical protein
VETYRRSPSYPGVQLEEDDMPVLLLWAVPAVIIVGGGVYLIGHLH